MGDVLDVSGLIAEPYDLEVSSPGLDRELKKDREFAWAVGKEVRCWLREPLDGRRELPDVLVAVTPEALTVAEAGRTTAEVPRRLLTKARLGAAGCCRSGSRVQAMINKELIYVIQQIGNEKGIGVEVLFEALESALLVRVQEDHGRGRQCPDAPGPPHRRAAGVRPEEGRGGGDRRQARDRPRGGPRRSTETPSSRTRSRWSCRPRSSGASPRRPPSR